MGCLDLAHDLCVGDTSDASSGRHCALPQGMCWLLVPAQRSSVDVDDRLSRPDLWRFAVVNKGEGFA
jgi:hypothetical protein